MTAVLFDLFETLVTESGTSPTRASTLGPMLKLGDSEFRAQWKSYRPRVLLGQCTFEEALRAISKSLDVRADDAAIMRICALRAAEKAALFHVIDEEVASMIHMLSDRGHRLALLSNCFAEDVVGWSECAIAGNFSCTAFSHDIGAAKPHPEIYLYATRQLGVEPGSAVFIGDGGDGELDGAERAGLASFRAGWFTGDRGCLDATTRRALRRCGDVLKLLSA